MRVATVFALRRLFFFSRMTRVGRGARPEPTANVRICMCGLFGHGLNATRVNYHCYGGVLVNPGCEKTPRSVLYIPRGGRSTSRTERRLSIIILRA